VLSHANDFPDCSANSTQFCGNEGYSGGSLGVVYTLVVPPPDLGIKLQANGVGSGAGGTVTLDSGADVSLGSGHNQIEIDAHSGNLSGDGGDCTIHTNGNIICTDSSSGSSSSVPGVNVNPEGTDGSGAKVHFFYNGLGGAAAFIFSNLV